MIFMTPTEMSLAFLVVVSDRTGQYDGGYYFIDKFRNAYGFTECIAAYKDLPAVANKWGTKSIFKPRKTKWIPKSYIKPIDDAIIEFTKKM